MLFTDCDFINSADLAAIDPEITKVASAESITIDTAGGIAAQACDEVGEKLLNELQSFTGFNPPYALPYNQTAAVLNLLGPSVNRPRAGLSQIVVTNVYPGKSSSLRRYAIYYALAMFYRAAFYKKLNDRYEKKLKMFEEEMRKKYWPRFVNQGLPVVIKPMPCPGAIHEYHAGTFDASRLSLVAGTNANPDTPYDVAITWVDQTRYISQTSKGNCESGPSAVIPAFNVTQNNTLRLDISNLNPPNGSNPVAVALGQGLIVPGNASGWNVWVGAQGQTLYLQNASPIPIGVKTYTLAGPPALSGYSVESGQYADQFYTMQRTIMRG